MIKDHENIPVEPRFLMQHVHALTLEEPAAFRQCHGSFRLLGELQTHAVICY